MQKLTRNPVPRRTNHQSLPPECGRRYVKSLWVLLLASAMMLSAWGGGASSGGAPPPAGLSGNWQFAMAEQTNPDPTQPSCTGGVPGAFLVQNKGPVTGTVGSPVT